MASGVRAHCHGSVDAGSSRIMLQTSVHRMGHGVMLMSTGLCGRTNRLYARTLYACFAFSRRGSESRVRFLTYRMRPRRVLPLV